MRKRITFPVMLLICVLVFTGCDCKHKKWKEADCVAPRTCIRCGQTEGEPLGHDFVSATCQSPAVCTICGETQGEALEHTWSPATCQDPSTCTQCGETSGEPQDHTWENAPCGIQCRNCCIFKEGTEVIHYNWLPANCIEPARCYHCGTTEGEPNGEHSWDFATTEAPKTCYLCGLTEGEPLQVDPRFKSSAVKPIQLTWEGFIGLPSSKFSVVTPDPAKCEFVLSFEPDGEMFLIFYAPNDNRTKVNVINYEGVYYVEDEFLYIGKDWDEPMTKIEMTFVEMGEHKCEKLILNCDIMEFCRDSTRSVKRDASIDISNVVLQWWQG